MHLSWQLKTKSVSIGVLAAGMFLTGIPSNAAQQLTYNESTVTSYPAGYSDGKDAVNKSAHEETGHEVVKITLAPSWFSVSRKEQNQIYDLANKRIVSVDTEKKQYSITDLHAFVFFRVAESQNRKLLGGLLKSAQINDGTGSDFEIESLFSMALPESPQASIENSKTGKTQTFMHKGREFVSVTQSDQPLDPSLVSSFRHYLICCTSIHPQILSALKDNKQILSSIHFVAPGVIGPGVTKTVDMKLDNESSVADDSLPMPAYYSETHTPFMQPVYAALAKLGPNPKLPTKAFATEYVQTAKKEGRLFDAFAEICEHGWTTNDDVVDLMKSIKEQVVTDDTARIVIANLSPTSKEEAVHAVAELEKIDQSKLQKGEALDVLIANNLQAAGKTSEACELMRSAIIRNPLLIGAYVDLFGMLCSTYKMDSAWEALNIAKQLNPTQNRVTATEAMGAHIEHDFPGFF